VRGKGATFETVAPAGTNPKNYEVWAQDLSRWILINEKLRLLRSAVLSEISNPDEPERDFRIRLQQRAREERDRRSEELRAKYPPKAADLDEKMRRAVQAAEREAARAIQQKMQTAISIGATLLGAFLGRRAGGTATLGRATTSLRGIGRTMREAGDVERA